MENFAILRLSFKNIGNQIVGLQKLRRTIDNYIKRLHGATSNSCTV